MKVTLGRTCLTLTFITGLHFLFVSVQNYGISYGSYQLSHSYYGLTDNGNSSQTYHYVNPSFAKLAAIKDRLLVRRNYSDFVFKAPRFADQKSKELWYKNGDNSGFMKAQPMTGYFSEVLFLRNGTFTEDKWCGYKGATDWVTQSQDGTLRKWIPSFIRKYWFPVLVALRNQDGHTFQHFTDGTLHRIVQILPLLQNRTVRLLVKWPRDNIVYDMLRKLRISSDQLVYQMLNTEYGADILIHSCFPDTLHPALWHEGRRLLDVSPRLNVPNHKAYIVIVTRDGCVNCGRRLLNLDRIVTLLNTRYGSHLVKVFRGHETLESSLELFGNSRIILGPHGGGLYNMNFAPYGTTIIEFMPTKQNGDTDIPGHMIFFKVSNLLFNEYWRVALPPGDNKNMVVDLDILNKILNTVDHR